MKPGRLGGLLGMVLLPVVLGAADAQTTYYWRTSNQDLLWSNRRNWSTTSAAGSAASSAPTNGDTLLFTQASGGVSTTMDTTLTAGFRRVEFGGSAVYTLATTKALILNNGSGTNRELALTSSGGATINLGGATSNLQLATSATFINDTTAGTLAINGSTSSIALGTNTLTLVTSALSSTSYINIGAPITGTGSLSINPTGVGQVTLSGANTYTGTTTVGGGVLNAMGSSSSSVLTLNATATLTGTGFIGGSGTNIIYGTVQPGNPLNVGNTSGNLRINGNLDLRGTYNWELSSASGTAGTNWDLITVNGSLSTGTGTRTIYINNNDASWTFTQGRSYKIISTTSAVSQTIVDQFTLAFGLTGTYSWGTTSISSFKLKGQSDGVYLYEDMVAVPEAGTYGWMSTGVVVLLVCRRIKHRHGALALASGQ